METPDKTPLAKRSPQGIPEQQTTDKVAIIRSCSINAQRLEQIPKHDPLPLGNLRGMLSELGAQTGRVCLLKREPMKHRVQEPRASECDADPRERPRAGP